MEICLNLVPIVSWYGHGTILRNFINITGNVLINLHSTTSRGDQSKLYQHLQLPIHNAIRNTLQLALQTSKEELGHNGEAGELCGLVVWYVRTEVLIGEGLYRSEEQVLGGEISYQGTPVEVWGELLELVIKLL